MVDADGKITDDPAKAVRGEIEAVLPDGSTEHTLFTVNRPMTMFERWAADEDQHAEHLKLAAGRMTMLERWAADDAYYADCQVRYPYVWMWGRRRYGPPLLPFAVKVPWFGDGVNRKGQRCRVVVRGTMNSAWIEFEDGYQVVTSRGGLRRKS